MTTRARHRLSERSGVVTKIATAGGRARAHDTPKQQVTPSYHDFDATLVWQPDPMLAEAAERLWTVLVRGAPAPGRAEPASLLAFSAYQRGDGVLTGVALDNAEAADPEHRLTGMLRSLLALALPPDRIRHTAHSTRLSVRERIEKEAQQ